jgi:hypothetical protein
MAQGTIPDEAARAIFGAATSCPEISGAGDRGKMLPEFAVVVRDVWSVKAPAAVHQSTGRSERTCRAWCADIEAGSSATFALLRGAEGYRFLARVMRDDPPAWWVTAEHHRKLGADIERRVREG